MTGLNRPTPVNVRFAFVSLDLFVSVSVARSPANLAPLSNNSLILRVLKIYSQNRAVTEKHTILQNLLCSIDWLPLRGVFELLITIFNPR